MQRWSGLRVHPNQGCVVEAYVYLPVTRVKTPCVVDTCQDVTNGVGPDVIQKEAWSFYRTISGVHLCWELEEPKGPKGSATLRPRASNFCPPPPPWIDCIRVGSAIHSSADTLLPPGGMQGFLENMATHHQ